MVTRKTLVDFIAEDKYDRYNEILNNAAERFEEYKKTHKTERKPRAPMTDQQKIEAMEKRQAKLQAKLDAMLAAQTAD